MTMPDNNNNSKKNDGVRKHINEIRNQVERLRKMVDEISDGKESPQDNSMAFFSMNPQDTEFISAVPTQFGDNKINHPQKNKKSLSPDLAQFFLAAGMLLHDALYLPFAKGRGRLTDFFNWVEKASDRMGKEDFNDDERQQFLDWCANVGAALLAAQEKHGLWLTDDEEDLVLAMSNSDLLNNDGELGNDSHDF